MAGRARVRVAKNWRRFYYATVTRDGKSGWLANMNNVLAFYAEQ